MKKSIIFLILSLVFISCNQSVRPKEYSFRQLLTLFNMPNKSYSVASTTAMYDENKVNKPFTFFIDESNFDFFLDSVYVGNELGSISIDKYPLTIYLIKNKAVMDIDISINPNNQNMLIEGKYFYFDISQFERLNNLYQFEYKVEKRTFNSNNDYAQFVWGNISDSNFIFYNFSGDDNGNSEVYSYWKN